MDKQYLVNELTISLADKCNCTISDLKAVIEKTLSEYSVSKMQTTLPSTGDGSTTMYLYSEFTKSKIAEGVKANTLKAYERSLNILYNFVNKELNLCSTKDVRDFLDYYRLSGENGERKPNTVRNMYLYLSSFYTWLYNNKYMAENIFANIKAPKGQIPHKVVLSESELEKMVIKCEKDFAPLKATRNIALVMFLLDSGLRVSELVNLNLDNVDLDNRIVYVKNGKGGKDRETAFSEKTAERLHEYFKLRQDIKMVNGTIVADAETPLFTTLYRKKSRLSTDGVREIIKELNPRAYPHLFRATSCTNKIMAGVTPVVVQSMMGHASMDMTNRYTKISNEQMRESMRKTF